MEISNQIAYPEGWDIISGFGPNSSYEKACQAIVIATVNYFRYYPQELQKFFELNSYLEIDKALPQLNSTIILLGEKLGGGFTSAQVGASLSHAGYALRYGWHKYLLKLREKHGL